MSEVPLYVSPPLKSRKADVLPPGKGNSNSYGARPVRPIITMLKWIRTSRLSIEKSLLDLSGKASFRRRQIAVCHCRIVRILRGVDQVCVCFQRL